MNPRRIVPSLGAGALLLVAAVGAGTREPARPASPEILLYPHCAVTVQSGPHDATWSISPGLHLVQPVAGGSNLSACSLYVSAPAGEALGTLTLIAWDPASLTPAPSSLLLRTQYFGLSAALQNRVRMEFVPPIVQKVARGVAEIPPPVALDFWTGPLGMALEWTANGPASVPTALLDSAGVLAPLAGAHPMLTHWICGGDASLQALVVTQCVSRADTLLSDVVCHLQRFRVPTRTQVSFVELAFGDPDTRYGGEIRGMIAILDGQGNPAPPADTSGALASADLPVGWTYLPSWASHADFTTTPLLEPGHDYWLWVQCNSYWRTYARRLDGNEPAAFTAGIGPLYRRPNIGDPFTLDPTHALDFKLVGVPEDATTVPPSVALASPLRLRVMPNPARGASLVAWSGASGRVRFDVMDQAGRHVSGGMSTGGAGGQWLWRAANDAGRAVPAGVYFVRATDAAGHAAVERVVVVR